METRYVKFNYQEALESKKQLLSSEFNLLQTAKRVKNYKTLRKKELVTKNKLKTALRNLRIKINSLQSNFPQEEMPKPLKKAVAKHKKKQEQNIQEQLQEIQDKLTRLQ